jgi:murein DD-endopeptidase MepM/ murein hydrolase activator NlpD
MENRHGSIFNSPNFQGFVILIVVLGVGGYLLMSNTDPGEGNNYEAPGNPAAVVATQSGFDALQNEQRNPATARPTSTLAPTNPVAPTVTPLDPLFTPQVRPPDQIEAGQLPTATLPPSSFLTPTIRFIGSTPVPSPTGAAVAAANEEELFEIPAEEIPLSLQFGDHFYMRRPLDVSANTEQLFYYPYGSTGQVGRIHHGIDIPNPVGKRVLATGDGTVIWADRVLQDERTEDGTTIFASYGNVVIIEHDISTPDGQKIWSLYAHLKAILVDRGQRVTMGTPIGLVGDTGIVTGSHVHYEVRVGENQYNSTRNPLLWIAPYLDHGVVAGKVIDEDGRYIDALTVQLLRGGRRVDSTFTYERPKQPGERAWHPVPDEYWQENFVFGDVPEGEYQVVILFPDNQRLTKTITVKPSMVNFVEFQLNPPAATPLPPDESGS